MAGAAPAGKAAKPAEPAETVSTGTDRPPGADYIQGRRKETPMDPTRKELIKAAIRRIHGGEKVEELKAEFALAVKGLTETEVAEAEQEAMAEGATVDDVRALCGAHLEVFRASMAEKPIEVPHWHPLHIQEEEHIDMANKIGLAKTQVHALLHGAAGAARDAAAAKLAGLVAYLGKAASNFLKQENVFFPALERHGIAQPPKVMWAEHDLLRAAQKKLAGLAAAGIEANVGAIRDAVLEYEKILLDHVMKERSILFPASLSLFSEKEWIEVRRDFDDVGYFAFFPMPLEFALAEEASKGASSDASIPGAPGGLIDLDTGYLSRRELVAMLKALPVDVTFVDADDKVKYFSETPERIFVRTKSVIGRSVQNCHPPKSVHVVTEILDDFRSGKKDSEDFWLHMGEKYVYIRYFAVRGSKGEYLGALEVSQDIAPIKAIEGEKRIVG
jgi:DUF438 domain-containing protein